MLFQLQFLQYGEIEEMNVCDNLGDHLVGNVYVKFRYEEDAEKAVKDLDNRWYNGKVQHSLVFKFKYTPHSERTQLFQSSKIKKFVCLVQ